MDGWMELSDTNSSPGSFRGGQEREVKNMGRNFPTEKNSQEMLVPLGHEFFWISVLSFYSLAQGLCRLPSSKGPYY